jgi:hypothetical protein
MAFEPLKQDYCTYESCTDGTCASCVAHEDLRQKVITINRMLEDARKFAAANDLVVGVSRNCVGALSLDTFGSSEYADMGWTDSSICE